MKEKTKQETALVSIDKESLHKVIKEYLKENLKVYIHREEYEEYLTIQVHLEKELIVESDRYYKTDLLL